MRKEYQDDPGNRGVECITKEEMDEFCRLADAAGIQVVTHVIGDRAIEDVIESYEKVLHDGRIPCATPDPLPDHRQGDDGADRRG